MKHDITSKNRNLEIKISGINSKQEELMANFRQCQEGSCDCPSEEYVKLENLDIHASENEIVLNLTPKKDQEFIKEEVEKCVDYVIKKVSDK